MPDTCPTCGSDDPKVRGHRHRGDSTFVATHDPAEYPGDPELCPDAFHATPSPTPAPWDNGSGTCHNWCGGDTESVACYTEGVCGPVSPTPVDGAVEEALARWLCSKAGRGEPCHPDGSYDDLCEDILSAIAALTTAQQEAERMEAEKQEAAKAWGRYALLRIDHENPYAGCEDLAALTDYFGIDFAALATHDGGDE